MVSRRLALLLVIAFVAVLTAPPVFAAADSKLVVFVEVDDPVTKKKLKERPDISKRHQFPNGFSATISAGSRKGIEGEPGVTVHDVPVYQLTATPSDQTPYGIEQIYNDPTITSTTGGAGVVIGHLDTGANIDHPDLKNRIIGCKDTTKRGVRNGCRDDNGHGTHTLGTALADGGDGTGVFGVAPDAMAYVVKVCKSGCWTDDIAAAIDFLGDKVQIITMSIGGDIESGLIRDAINRNLHILYVAAAGNDGPGGGSIDYPGANPNVIAVAALDSTETVASFSSRGIDDGDDTVISEREVELAAAGVGVESTWNDGGYNTISGTSMATPHIAGLAAREWQGTAADTRSYLRTYVEDVILANGGGAATGYDIASGYGLGHVTPVGPPPEPPTLLSISVTPSSASIVEGQTRQFTATGSFDDGTTADLTSTATWASSNTAVATIDGSGLATGVLAGTTDITASQEGVTSNIASLEVTAPPPPPTLLSIDVTPASASIAEGQTQQFTATGSFDDGSTANITSAATWASSNTAVATIDGSGLAIGVSVGTTDITASQDGVTSNIASLEVTAVTSATTVSVVSITYATEGGKNKDKHLLITMALLDDLGDPVGGASVSIDLYRDGALIASGTGTTGTAGTLTFSVKNAKNGCYTTTVTDVTADGLTWDGATPANEFCK